MTDDDTYTCKCGWFGDISDCDGMGACDGCAFCPQCNIEFDTLTGDPHERGECCIDVMIDGDSPRCPVDDTVASEQLLGELYGAKATPQSLFGKF